MRLDPDLLNQIREKAKSLDIDVSTFVRWCLQTGLFLGDVNSFVRSKMAEKSFQ